MDTFENTVRPPQHAGGDPLTKILFAHRFTGETYEPTGESWVDCSCSRTEMWSGPRAWPVTPIRRIDAELLHAIHVAAMIREAGVR